MTPQMVQHPTMLIISCLMNPNENCATVTLFYKDNLYSPREENADLQYVSRVCKFYCWVESVWLLLHKFWSPFGVSQWKTQFYSIFLNKFMPCFASVECWKLMHPPLAKCFFLFALLQTVQNIFSFLHHSVTTEILPFLAKPSFWYFFLVALCSLRTPFSDFPACGPGMYTPSWGIHEVPVVVHWPGKLKSMMVAIE